MSIKIDPLSMDDIGINDWLKARLETACYRVGQRRVTSFRDVA